MLSHVAPAGTPIRIGDLATGFSGFFAPRGAAGRLAGEIRRVTGVRHAWPVSSGRAAMSVILQAMKAARGEPSIDEVVIPAYTCYSVPAAVERAGLRPRLVDVDPATFSMSPESLVLCDFSRVLAVCPSNLYGIPDDLGSIEEICRRNGVFMLDDAAQCLGAYIDGRAVGTFGDAGIYSFDKGKIISTMQGGCIVASDSSLVPPLTMAASDLSPTGRLHSGLLYAQLVAYSALLHPVAYGLVNRVPGTGLGTTRYTTVYPIAQLSAPQSAVAARLLRRLRQLNDGRREHATQLTAAIAGMPGVTTPTLVSGSLPVFARYPIRVPPTSRKELIDAMTREGIGATASYPRALIDVLEVASKLRKPHAAMPGARNVASSVVTLPTHGYCPRNLPERIRRILERFVPDYRPGGRG